ncbi:restriction endonuclease subunit S [Gilliamella sp. CG22]|uniref:restriction endonuclease subunit S n=1 Tax=Gilliamella sp. CG22 TaxID=3351504 RepID=UPI0039889B22
MIKTQIGQRVVFEYGYAVRVKDEPKGKYPVYGSNGITGYIDSYKVKGPGVIVGRKGSVGSVVYSENNFTPIDTSYFLKILDLNKDDLRFWSYFLQTIDLKKLNTHSAVPGLSRELVYLLEVNIPSKDAQGKISYLLSKIDKKIELNNQINAELESMAKTLYDYWFVQFDFPNENGKPYKSSGGKMVYNSVLKREIPYGWNDSQIGKIENKIITGKTPPKGNSDYFSGDVPFITIGDIRGNTFIVNTEETLSREGADFQKSKYLPEDTICVTCIATPGLVGLTTTLSQTNQQINSIICSKEYHKYFLYFALKSYFNANSKVKIGNTFANINKRDFSEIKIIYPSESLLINFHKKVSSIFEKIKSNTKESRKISELRDFLLPMLMNGQVTIKE